MATLNLGRIKPVFQGAYNNSTAYVVDDIVTFGDETFICIQASTGNATSNTSYWTKLAAKGTDGTDVGTTITTQGDILYRDGSGLQRLGAGTAGQLLQTGGSGANPSWTNAPQGGAISTHFSTYAGSTNTNSNSYQQVGSGFTVTLTPASTSSKILLLSSLNVYGNYCHITYFRGSTNLATDKVSTTDRIIHQGEQQWINSSMSFIDQPNTTSSVTYEIKFKASASTSAYVGDGNAILNTFLAIEL